MKYFKITLVICFFFSTKIFSDDIDIIDLHSSSTENDKEPTTGSFSDAASPNDTASPKGFGSEKEVKKAPEPGDPESEKCTGFRV